MGVIRIETAGSFRKDFFETTAEEEGIEKQYEGKMRHLSK